MDRVKPVNAQFNNSSKVLGESLQKMHDYHDKTRSRRPSTFDGYQILMDYNTTVDNFADSLKKLVEQLVKANREIPENIKGTLTSYYSEVYKDLESHGKAYKGIHKYIERSLNYYVGLNTEGKTAIDFQKEKIELEPLEVEMNTYLDEIKNATFTDEILSITAKKKKRLNKYFETEHKNCQEIKTELENLKNKLLECTDQNMDKFSISEKQKCVKYVIAYNKLARKYNSSLLELARLEEKIIIVREKRFDPKEKEEKLKEKLEKHLDEHPDPTCPAGKFIGGELARFKRRKEAYKKNSRTFAKLGYKTGEARERVNQMADDYYPADFKMIFDKATLWISETLPSMESRRTELEKKAEEILKIGRESIVADQSAISSNSKQPFQTLIGSVGTPRRNGLSSKNQPDVSLLSTKFDKPSKFSKLLNRAKGALGINKKTYKVSENHERKEAARSH